MSTDAVVSIALGAWLAGSFPFAALIGTALRRSSRADPARTAPATRLEPPLSSRLV